MEEHFWGGSFLPPSLPQWPQHSPTFYYCYKWADWNVQIHLPGCVSSFDQPGATNSSMVWHLVHSRKSVSLKHPPLQEKEHPHQGGRAAELASLQNNSNPSPKCHPKPCEPEEITDPLLKKPRISHSPIETAARQSRGRNLQIKKDPAVTPGGTAERVPLLLCQQSAGRKQLRSKDQDRPEAREEQPPSPRLEAAAKKEENVKKVKNWLCIDKNLAKWALTAYG